MPEYHSQMPETVTGWVIHLACLALTLWTVRFIFEELPKYRKDK